MSDHGQRLCVCDCVSDHGQRLRVCDCVSDHGQRLFSAWLQVAQLVGADPKEIIFTSGATESNNLALKGVAMFYKERKRHVITTQTEHKCVLDSCR